MLVSPPCSRRTLALLLLLGLLGVPAVLSACSDANQCPEGQEFIEGSCEVIVEG